MNTTSNHPPPTNKRKRQTFGPNVHIHAFNFSEPKGLAEVMCIKPELHDEKTLKEWIDGVILDDFIIRGSTSKFTTLEKYKKLAVPILLKMMRLVQNYEIEIFKYSDFQKIIRKASLGECFSEAESDDEDSPTDDEDEDV